MLYSGFNIKLRAPTPCTKTFELHHLCPVYRIQVDGTTGESGKSTVILEIRTEPMKFRLLCNHRHISIDTDRETARKESDLKRTGGKKFGILITESMSVEALVQILSALLF